jgi:spore coat polysaccharide biosynthesis protein SpsF (cytidylyltransferase family)
MDLNSKLEIWDHESPKGDAQAAMQSEDKMLIEGVTPELEKHPQLYRLLKELNSLKNKMVREVEQLSEDFELDSSVKVFFSIREKEN